MAIQTPSVFCVGNRFFDQLTNSRPLKFGIERTTYKGNSFDLELFSSLLKKIGINEKQKNRALKKLLDIGYLVEGN